MAPRRKPKPDIDSPDPSAIYLDGYLRLAAAIVSQAFFDLRRTVEVERAVESFVWLVYGDGLIMLNSIGFEELDEINMLQAIGRIGNDNQTIFRERQRASKHHSASNQGHEFASIGQVS